jgi:hypothetical protein
MKPYPCPHCGSTKIDIYTLEDSLRKEIRDLLRGRNTEYKVECWECDPYQPTKEDAIKMWNTRHHYYPEPFDVEKYYAEETE